VTTISVKPAVSDLAGLPFLDDSFAVRRLLHAGAPPARTP
jgi:hypothetical protein